MQNLAFCFFAKKLYIATHEREDIIDAASEKLETIIFKALENYLPYMADLEKVITFSGPGPFTQLRIMRAVQLGIAAGYCCKSPLINAFEILRLASGLDKGKILLSTRRGDYFFCDFLKNRIFSHGVTNDVPPKQLLCISDNPEFNTVKIKENLALIMLKNLHLANKFKLDYGLPTYCDEI